MTNCRCVRNDAVQAAIQRDNSYEAFTSLTVASSGIFIVRVLQENVVDHAVAIDAARNVIIDSAENFGIELSVSNLKRCGGNDSTDLRVVEVRQVIAV